MKSVEEFNKSVFSKRDIALKRKRKYTAIIIGCFIICAVSVTAAALPVLSREKREQNTVDPETAAAVFTENESGSAETEEVKEESFYQEKKSAYDMPDCSNPYYGSTERNAFNNPVYGGPGSVSGGLTTIRARLTEKDVKGSITESGEIISEEEAEEYLIKNRAHLLAGIAFDSSVGCGEFRLYTKGYSHVTLDRKGNKTLNRSMITFPIMKSGVIVGCVDLFKVNGEIGESVAYGGESFKKLTEIFASSPDESFAFVYLDEFPEMIISSKNKLYFNPEAIETESGVDYYSYFETPYNTFSQSEIDNSDNYLSVAV